MKTKVKPKVYIDGKDGTTGLQIYDRLSRRDDITLLLIDEAKRKDVEERRKLMNGADLVFLCLPDAAAEEAVGLVENPETRIIDASTAHRTASGWTYGFPELSPEHREAVRNSRRVANPGCHATGFISVVYPLTAAGVLPKDAALSCFSLTGYSGGGKKMIAEYENPDRDAILGSPALYAVGQAHKHLPEMRKVCGLDRSPVFCPIVDDYYKGMVTTVPLHMTQLSGVKSKQDVVEIYQKHYNSLSSDNAVIFSVSGRAVTVQNGNLELENRIHGAYEEGFDDLIIYVGGNDARITISAVFDNLGKGASGAAVQNMNLMLGFPELKGLRIPGVMERVGGNRNGVR